MVSLKALAGIGLVAAVTCSGCSPTLTVSAPTLMSGVDAARGKRGAVARFDLNDRIIQIVDFTWSDPQQDGGLHECEWKWYRAGKLVSDTPERELRFRKTPYTLYTARPAAPLGAGQYTVDTIVDGKVVATSAFSIVA